MEDVKNDAKILGDPIYKLGPLHIIWISIDNQAVTNLFRICEGILDFDASGLHFLVIGAGNDIYQYYTDALNSAKSLAAKNGKIFVLCRPDYPPKIIAKFVLRSLLDREGLGAKLPKEDREFLECCAILDAFGELIE